MCQGSCIRVIAYNDVEAILFSKFTNATQQSRLVLKFHELDRNEHWAVIIEAEVKWKPINYPPVK